MKPTIEPGTPVVVNGDRDLWMDVECRPFIDRRCVVVKVCKSGLVQVICNGRMVSVPRRNLTVTAAE